MSRKDIPAIETEDILKLFNSNDKEEIHEDTKNKNKPINELNRKWDMNDKIVNLFTDNISTDRTIRNTYAIILLIILGIQLVALTVIFILTGANVLHYSDATLNIYVTAGIAEVFVLIRVIVKYLFKDNISGLLNTIIENNNPIKRYQNFNKNKADNKKENIEKN